MRFIVRSQFLTAAVLSCSLAITWSGGVAADRYRDGASQAVEQAARRPAAAPCTRYIAEGSTGFFEKAIAILNLSATETSRVALSLLSESGGVGSENFRAVYGSAFMVFGQPAPASHRPVIGGDAEREYASTRSATGTSDVVITPA